MSTGYRRKAAENSALVMHNSLHEVKIKAHFEVESYFFIPLRSTW